MKNTHLTATAAAVAEAVEKFDACRPDEAIARLERHAAEAGPLSPEETLWVSNNLAAFARQLGRLDEARRIHKEAARLADDERIDPRRRGQFHNGYAATLFALGEPRRDTELLRAAIIEYTAASYYYEVALEYRLRALAENNLALVKAMLGCFDEALRHVVTALGSCPGNDEVLTQVEDTQAVIALEAGRPEEALSAARAAERHARRLGNKRLIEMCLKTSRRAEAACLRELEERRIRGVLEACEWSLTRAFPCLGFNSREALTNHLKRHFPRLEAERRNRSVTSSDGA
jgi:tetratricopeptide (TPR) repeat protein